MVSKVEANRPKTGGRKKGTPNKTTALLKDAILKAADDCGNELSEGKGGLVDYLRIQARVNPGPFLSLLGKVLPMQIAGDPDNPVPVIFNTVYEKANGG